MFADLLKQHHHHHIVNDEYDYMKGAIVRLFQYDDDDNDDFDDPPSESYHSRIHRGLGLYSRKKLRSGETQGRPAIILVQNTI